MMKTTYRNAVLKRVLSSVILFASAAFVQIPTAESQTVKVYRGGFGVERPENRAVPQLENGVYVLRALPIQEPFFDIPELSGGPEHFGQEGPVTRKPTPSAPPERFCRANKDEICVYRASQIIYAPRHRN